jgi:hypothetical protein
MAVAGPVVIGPDDIGLNSNRPTEMEPIGEPIGEPMVSYGPGILPAVLATSALTDAQQIDLLCRIAASVPLPVFHERVGHQVYRIAKAGSQIQIAPIADRHNAAVAQAIAQLRRPIPRKLLDWLTVPLLLPCPQRGQAPWSIADSPIAGWSVKPLRDGINTVAWLKQEAQDNQTDRHATGYTAQFRSQSQSKSQGSGDSFVELEQQYSRLLECMQYCDRFKFIVSVYPIPSAHPVPSHPTGPCP